MNASSKLSLKLTPPELACHPELAQLLAGCRFPPASSAAVCAVSGGADSAALLILAVAAGCRTKAVYVNHQLRPEADADGRQVAALAAALGAGFEQLVAPVEPGPNLEARARQARYQALPAEALVGHTADDQAETVLLNLLRGSGVAGLAGMRQNGRRPLLGLRREQTERVCELAGYVPVADSMNDDPAFRRNRVRHELLPLLAELAERDVVPLLCRTAELCREADEVLTALNPEVDASDTKALRELPESELRLAVRRWVTDQVGLPPDLASVQRILEVVQGKSVGTHISGGHHVRRSQGRLSLTKSA